MKKILLLEDDTALNETVTEFLQEEGFSVISAFSGQEAEALLYETRFDLLILDVHVPSPNGFELLKDLRERHDTTPAIFMTTLHELEDVETGYQSGCDDYIRKPFALKELLLRIEAIFKRDFFHNDSHRLKLDSHISFDTKNDTLFIDNQKVHLHDKAKRLLKLFLQHKGELLSHESLYEALWDYDETPSDEALRTYIKELRKLLGKERIESIKRYGYTFS